MNDGDNDDRGKIVPAGRLTFLQDPKKHSLAKTLKKLDGNVNAAIDFLSEVMKDPEADLRLRVDCAKEILSKKQSISEAISKETLARQIAESRLMLASNAQMRVKNIDQDDDEPSVMFVQDIIVDSSGE